MGVRKNGRAAYKHPGGFENLAVRLETGGAFETHVSKRWLIAKYSKTDAVALLPRFADRLIHLAVFHLPVERAVDDDEVGPDDV